MNSKLNIYVFKAVIISKCIISVAFLIGIVLRVVDHYVYIKSEFPEHIQFAIDNRKTLLNGTFLFVPLVMSLIIDIKEYKSNFLKNKWLVVNVFLLICYILSFQFMGHFVYYLVLSTLIMVLTYYIIVFQFK